LTQVPLQELSGVGQVAVQAPFTHVLPPGHCVPQPLQYWGSVWGLTQAWPPVTGQSSGVVVLQVASHDPLAHFGAPVEAPETGEPHAVEHPPQWSTSVCSSKQPVEQRSGRPGISQAVPHVPAEQTGVPSAIEVVQTLLHAPQFWASVCSATQRPLQLVKPASQATPHTAAVQVAAPLAGAGHFIPQAPQFRGSDWSSRQAPLHEMNPVLQLKPHVELAHFGVPLAGAMQVLPQVAQFLGSVVVSTQLLPQVVGVGAMQEVTHAPPEQTWLAPQAMPQAPQLFLSLDRLTQAPLQAVYEALQEMPQVELEQVAAPLAGAGQALAQAPQLATSDLRSTHAPPHLAKPRLQAMPQVELEQVAVPLVGAAHA
jgi:hypothetical protein